MCIRVTATEGTGSCSHGGTFKNLIREGGKENRRRRGMGPVEAVDEICQTITPNVCLSGAYIVNMFRESCHLLPDNFSCPWWRPMLPTLTSPCVVTTDPSPHGLQEEAVLDNVQALLHEDL